MGEAGFQRRGIRRALLISYFFPPEPSSGARRPSALAERLPAHGWEVDVLTRLEGAPPVAGRRIAVPYRPWIQRLREAGIRPDRWFRAPPKENWRAGIVEAPRHFSARVWNLVRATAYQAATFPDRAIGWRHPALGTLRDILRERAYDAVISTSPPEAAHFIGREARRVGGSVWIADLRDPWSSTHLADRPAWRRRLDALAERAVLRDADALVTVSRPIAERMEHLHGRAVHLIRNGFDPDVFPGPTAPDRTAFRIVYTGEVSPGRHELPALVEGLRQFLDRAAARGDSPPLQLQFLGEESNAVRVAFERAGLAAHVRLEPRRPHAEAAAALRTAAVNLFLVWQDPAFPGVYSGKLFEYLGARRPVLAIGTDPGVAGELLEQTGAGRLARTAGEVASLLDELWRAHRDGRDAWTPDEARVLEHSHERMVASFARVLDDALARRA